MIVLDLETQRTAAEVGGWGNIEAMQMSVACTWDEDGGYLTWWEAQAADLIDRLNRADEIVGFNISAFDYRVLALYGDTIALYPKTFDLHQEIWQQLHKRVGLATLARLNLGEAKALESGITAVQLYQAGELEQLAAYCQTDVELTKRLYELWQEQRLLFIDAANYVVWPKRIRN